MNAYGRDKDGVFIQTVNAEDKPSTSGPYYRDKDGWHVRVKLEGGGAAEPGPKGDKGDPGAKGDKGDKGDPGKDAEPQFTSEQVDSLLALLE